MKDCDSILLILFLIHLIVPVSRIAICVFESMEQHAMICCPKVSWEGMTVVVVVVVEEVILRDPSVEEVRMFSESIQSQEVIVAL